MAIILNSIKLVYVPAPKIACTSLKLMFYNVENGRDFEGGIRSSEHFHIHNYYFSAPFEDVPHETIKGHEKICVVRDPVKRFLSSYANRVVYHGELSESSLTAQAIAAGAIPNPSFEDYVERLELYRDFSESIRHHTDPQVYFYGTDRRYFETIYKMSELELLRARVSDMIGRPLELTHSQSGGEKIDIENISSNAREKIQKFYSIDYELYGDF